MSTLNKIQGRSEQELSLKVEKSVPPKTSSTVTQSDPKVPDSINPRGIQEVLRDSNGPVSNSAAPSYEETREVAQKLQSRIDELASDPHQVEIHTDESTNEFVIEIKDPEGKVVKQFPPEKVLNLREKLDDLSGMVIDEMI